MASFTFYLVSSQRSTVESLGECVHLRRLWKRLVKKINASTRSSVEIASLLKKKKKKKMMMMMKKMKKKKTRTREIAYQRIFAQSIGGAYDTLRHRIITTRIDVVERSP